ncbi:hypothetical protein [Saccharopolyspora pogona]|uniref:hypothetical protein n=1 Tax=Saccharopolyspora pogona TaxID=333966 RepID=UPI0037CAC76F
MGNLETYVRQHIAKYKVPREWHVVAKLPRNPGGRLSSVKIRADYINSRKK